MNDWTARHDLLIASTRIGTGASARSSIVRCQENSITSGNVTAMIPCMSSMEAIRPGTRIVAKLMLPAVPTREAADAPPSMKPPPIFGNTYAKTKTNSSGCMTARVNREMELRRSTRNSRAIMALNVLSRVGRGSGALLISAATSEAAGTPYSATSAGAFLVVVVITLGTPVRSG